MKFPASKVMPRYSLVASVLTLIGLAILVKAACIMSVEKDYWMKVSTRFVRTNVPVVPTRGNILACNGEVLAASLPEFRMYMDFMSWEKDSTRRAKDQLRRDSMLLPPMIDSVCNGMHSIFPDIDPVEFRQLLEKGRALKRHHWPLYKKRITYIQYRQVLSLPWFRMSKGRSGFHVDTFKTRVNPYGDLACRTIGDLYKEKDSARTGLELKFDKELRGVPGLAHRQKVLSRYHTFVDRPAVDGCDIVTTLDVNMQDICEKALGDKLEELEAQSGVCILMEVGTGDIKAMTSLTRMADGSYREINADAVKNLYEPGSVFKPMSFLVGMDDGYIHMTDVVDVGCGIKEMYGRKMRDANWRSGGSGVVTVPQILQKSLNVGVSTLIDRFYHNQPEKFVDGIYRIGVAEDLKIPIPGYAKPRIRRPKPDGSNWSNTALPWMSIGYETQIPPITTVNFYNGIANNGRLLRPRLVKAIMRGDEVVKEYPVVVLREHMAKPEAVKNIQDCLESVVSVGLGKKAGSKYFHVSGKTGTAQIWTKHGFDAQYLVSFAGYFPSEQPLYSCIVCIRKGSPASGGGMCAPVFKRVAETVMAQRRVDDYADARDTLHCLNPVVNAGNLQAAASVLDQLGVLHQTNLLSAKNSPLAWGTCTTTNGGLQLSEVKDMGQNVMPDVSGYGLRDALFRLEKMGLKVQVHGVGRVNRQSMQPGHVFKRGDVVTLYLGDAAEAVELQADSIGADSHHDEESVDDMVQHEMEPHEAAPGQKVARPAADNPAPKADRSNGEKKKKDDAAKKSAKPAAALREDDNKPAQKRAAKSKNTDGKPAASAKASDPKEKTKAKSDKKASDKKSSDKKSSDKKSSDKKSSDKKSSDKKASEKKASDKKSSDKKSSDKKSSDKKATAAKSAAKQKNKS